MEPPPVRRNGCSNEAGVEDSNSTTAPIPGFQAASTLPRVTHVPSTNSNRNASGGLPPLPPPPPADTEAGASTATTAAAPAKPVNRPAASRNAIVHSVLQRRNPILPLIRNVGLEIGDIVADYQVGAHAGVLFLSLKYHRLHPEYIFGRIEKMRNMYNLRILLILCDILTLQNEHQQPLRELSKVAVVNDLTVIVAFSNEEAAQYLTTFKAYEHKSADTLKERVRQTFPEQLEHVLTSGRKVNKANAETLAATFGSFANMVRQPSTVLTGVKGIGPTKTLSLYRAFNEPFMAGGSSGKGDGKGRGTGKGKGKGKSDEVESDMPPPPAPVPSGDKSSAFEIEIDSGPTDQDAGTVEQGTAGASEIGMPARDDSRDTTLQPQDSGTGTAPDEAASPLRPLESPSPPSLPSEAPRRSERPATPKRPDEQGPTRSPSVEPDEEHTATNEVWEDPLADDDEDDEDGDEQEDEDARPAKRARV